MKLLLFVQKSVYFHLFNAHDFFAPSVFLVADASVTATPTTAIRLRRRTAASVCLRVTRWETTWVSNWSLLIWMLLSAHGEVFSLNRRKPSSPMKATDPDNYLTSKCSHHVESRNRRTHARTHTHAHTQSHTCRHARRDSAQRSLPGENLLMVLIKKFLNDIKRTTNKLTHTQTHTVFWALSWNIFPVHFLF